MGAHHHHDELTHNRQVLWVALLLNTTMFVLELWQGIMAGSTALIADSMDFLSDAFSYIITMFVLTKPLSVRAKASLTKAFIMLLLAAAALAQGGYNLWLGRIPEYTTMGWVAVLALIANLATAFLLYSTRNQDSNMRSIWLCSRNDAITNVAVMVAAGLVYATGTLWPDLIVALIIAWLGVSAAVEIIGHARKELRQPR
ncbi:MAG: cation transporter [Rickettsiales bacterium]|nr:cation transporter [Rickettsiales bacterium]